MKTRFILYFILFPTLSLAQTNQAGGASETFDFLKANAEWKRAKDFSGTTPAAHPKSCVSYETETGERVMSCSVPDSEFTNSVIVKTPEFKEGNIPEAIKAVLPLEFVKDTVNKKVSCVFRFTGKNDNLQALGCKGSDGNKFSISSSEKCGDDWGYTHGLAVGVSCRTSDGLQQTFTYSTDLFSDPNQNTRRFDKKGILHMDQKFISENLFSYIEDNINQNKFSYWKQGVGFVNYSSKKKWGLLQSTGQQEWFHEFLNKHQPGSAADYNYVDGDKDTWGGFVTLATGLQARKKLGSLCQILGSVEVGARAATLKDANLVYAGAEGKVAVQIGEGQIYARSQLTTTVRPSSVVSEATLGAGYERPTGTKVEVGVTGSKGNRKDVPDTPNLVLLADKGKKKNDLIWYFNVQYQFYGP